MPGFVLDDAYLTQLAKQLRHDLVATSSATPLEHRLAARDTLHDVGVETKTATELSRTDAWDVCAANLSRLQQSLRSLEEFAKILSPESATKFEQLRYGSYTLAKALGAIFSASERLADVRLYVLVDGRSSLEEFRQLTQTLCESGVDVLQLRDKRLGDRELLARAHELVAICRQAEVLSIINDRPDLATIARADGVHVGQEELQVKDARALLGPNGLVGVSTHNLDQVRQAVLDGADYLGLGPTFPSQTKQFDKFPGLEFIQQATTEVRLPAFAIGGITHTNLPEVLAAGAERVAIGAAVTEAADPASAAQEISTILKTVPPTPVGG